MTEGVVRGLPMKSEFPKKSVGQFFFDLAQSHGEKIFQIDATKEIHESYISLNKRSVRAAIEMQKRGIASGDVVLLVQDNTLDTVVQILAAFYLGATVASVDPSVPEREAKHLTSLVTPRMVFADDASTPLVEKVLEESGIQAEIVVSRSSEKYSTFDEFLKPSEDEHVFLPVEVDLEDTIFITFSSGSTGLSKAIQFDHRGYLHLGFTLAQVGGNFEVTLKNGNFQWISATIALVTVFIRGGCRVFYSSHDVESFLRVVEKYKVTAAFMYTFSTYALTEFPDSHKYDTSSLNFVLVGGNPVAEAQLKRTRELFKTAAVVNSYGQSETGFLSLFDAERDADLIKTKAASCGKPLPGVSIKIVDPNTHETLGSNQVGEICCKSPSIMKGYKGVDNSEVFLEDGFLKTGDVGYYDEDHCFYVADRIKDMFNCGDYRIVPAALEAILLEHPEITEAAVIGIPDEEMGGLPAACVVLKTGCGLGFQEIDKYFSERVMDGERLIGGIRIVDRLPKTFSGKIKKRELRVYFEER